MTFSQYLQSRDHSEATIRTYEKYLRVFTGWLQSEYIHPDGVCYAELLAFMRWLQASGRSREAVAIQLCAVRHYFDWRIAIKAGCNNPAAGVYIKGIPRRLPAGMLGGGNAAGAVPQLLPVVCFYVMRAGDLGAAGVPGSHRS